MLNWLIGCNPLDRRLFWWDKQNALTLRQLLAGGIHAFGATGSGKSSTLIQLVRAILADRNSSMLILCAKRGEASQWRKLARRYRSKLDVMVINPRERWRLKPVWL